MTSLDASRLDLSAPPRTSHLLNSTSHFEPPPELKSVRLIQLQLMVCTSQKHCPRRPHENDQRATGEGCLQVEDKRGVISLVSRHFHTGPFQYRLCRVDPESSREDIQRQRQEEYSYIKYKRDVKVQDLIQDRSRRKTAQSGQSRQNQPQLQSHGHSPTRPSKGVLKMCNSPTIIDTQFYDNPQNRTAKS